MVYDYQPEIEEEDDGYSIPKILVAVLLLVVIGAGAYIYFQQKKLTTSVAYLKNAKKQVELDLNAMIEKYNLAIDDNDFLADELRDERDRIIRFRDSIKSIKGEDFGKITNYEEEIKKLKTQSAIVFEPAPITKINTSSAEEQEIVPVEVVVEQKREEKPSKSQKSKPKSQITSRNDVTIDNGDATTDRDIVSTEESQIPVATTVIEPVKETTTQEVTKKEEPVEAETPAKEKATTNFIRVEMPPTYPGCKGSATEKKACFIKKVKTHLKRKFDGSILDDLNLKSGKQRIWVAFEIDKYGNVANVNARSPKNISASAKRKLENEAENVIKKLPKMTPARQNGKSVKISYSVPITFDIP
jgi:hypothetical protein